MTERFDRAPVAADPAQWPEARGFGRTYIRDPDRQSCLVKALLGFRREIYERHQDEQIIDAIDVVLKAFQAYYPEFMQDGYVRDADSEWGEGVYHADDRLIWQMANILEGRDPAEM